MQIPETPSKVKDLDLMQRLHAYAQGSATWHRDGSALGSYTKDACETLYNRSVELVDKLLAPLLDRITSREMETFTMHDRGHGLKVAHLMWHILEPDRRECLTPPEIGMMVVAAHFHDLGMALDREEREARLDPESDLWDRLEIQQSQKDAIEELRARSADQQVSETMRGHARRRLVQAEEALLSQDTRERHGTPDRYRELLTKLKRFHQDEELKIPNVEACLSFDGDSFRDKLIDICVSHNQDAETLVQRDEVNVERTRFPSDYPVGLSTADLHMVASALRLADVLDFDRERTPPVLFHYLLPGALEGMEDRSVLEWGKHLAISNWHIEPEAIVFRGRTDSHIIHHAVVQFCSVIAGEIEATRVTFGALQETNWPFALPTSVKADIHEEGYRYVPYRFELDDERVYQLLMGGAIYENPLVAARELVQNAVDACMLRDAMTRLYEPYEPSTDDRIIVRYEDAAEDHPLPRLIVTDSGIGMDALIIERYFLRVGRSYYDSSDFNHIRFELRRHNMDFAPVSEFGIGFLSSFLLSDRLIVDTAMAEPIRDDSRKRRLQIDGPTRLIRLDERSNEGRGRFKGTSITLFLSRGSGEEKTAPPTSDEILEYLTEVCQDLPYRLNFEHVANGRVTTTYIDPQPLSAELRPGTDESMAVRIPVTDEEFGLEGEIALCSQYLLDAKRREHQLEPVLRVVANEDGEESQAFVGSKTNNDLLRGGFRIGEIPGLPFSYGPTSAKIRLTWKSNPTRRYLMPNLARSATTNDSPIAQRVERIWLSYLLENIDDLPQGLMQNIRTELQERLPSFRYTWQIYGSPPVWLERYDAYTIYQLARNGWSVSGFPSEEPGAELLAWENGEVESLPWTNIPTDLWEFLLALVLPYVTTMKVSLSGDEYRTTYVVYALNPPMTNWRDILQDCHTYITNPMSLEPFAEYVGNIEELLYTTGGYTRSMNSRFDDRFASFEPSEQEEIPDVLRVLDFYMREEGTAELTPTHFTLFQKLQEVASDLKVGLPEDSWTIGDVILP